MVGSLLKKVGWFLLLAVASLVPALTVYVDMMLFQRVAETGVTETLQHALVLVTASIFLYRAFVLPDQRGFLLLVAGFFFVVFIRETDGFLDAVRHGFWLYPALVTTLVFCVLAARCRQTILEPMLAFAHSNQGVILSIGLAVLLVFSRVFGTGSLWEVILSDRSTAVLVKTVVQEGLELLGYLLIFLGACYPREHQA